MIADQLADFFMCAARDAKVSLEIQELLEFGETRTIVCDAFEAVEVEEDWPMPCPTCSHVARPKTYRIVLKGRAR